MSAPIVQPINPCPHGVDLKFARCMQCEDPAFHSAQRPNPNVQTATIGGGSFTSKQQVDSAIRFTATEADLKAIRAAFEAVNPGARGWRKPDEKSVPDYEYYSPLARDAFYNFRDGWLAARASGETTADPLDYRLPCEIRLPPAMSIGRGCTLRTVMNALRVREGLPEEPVFADERAMAIRRALTELHRPPAGVTVSNEHEHATFVATDDGPCTTCNDSGWDCELQKPCDCGAGDVHRESSEKTSAEPRIEKQEPLT